MTENEWLGRVVSSLKRRVDPDPELTRRIVARVESGQSPGLRPRLRSFWLAGSLAAAAAVVIAVARSGGPAGRSEPAGTSPTDVSFEIYLAAATEVALVGDFNNWDRTGTPLAPTGKDGRWRTTISLPSGVYRYAFLVDNARWVGDPRQPTTVDRDFGAPTSLVTVK